MEKSNVFNFEKFKMELSKNLNIIDIKYSNAKFGTISITFKDGLIMSIDTRGDMYHKLYTFLDKDYPRYYYFGKMPHDTFTDLYQEINRMCVPETRTKLCKYGYFKCLF